MGLRQRFKDEIFAELKTELGCKSPMQVPKLTKIVLNTGLGEAAQNSKVVEPALYAMTQVSGQKPVVRRAKKSISNFKLREGMPIGCSVTLRGEKMYSFLERLITVALPRVRDFRGVSPKGFDGRGNYTMGIKEQIVFPEVNMDKLDKVRGFNVTFVTTADKDENARALLNKLGVPFRKQPKQQQ